MILARDTLPKSMSYSPGFTSGRGAMISDLDSEKLLFIHDKIKNGISEEAAENMVDMVQDLKVASCTGFLKELYMLERNDWIYNKKEHPKNEERNDLYCENMGEAEGTLLSTIFGGNGDDTLQIVSRFLSRFDKRHITESNKRIQIDKNGRTYRRY